MLFTTNWRVFRNIKEAENHFCSLQQGGWKTPEGSAPVHGINILKSQHFEMQSLMSHIVTPALWLEPLDTEVLQALEFLPRQSVSLFPPLLLLLKVLLPVSFLVSFPLLLKKNHIHKFKVSLNKVASTYKLQHLRNYIKTSLEKQEFLVLFVTGINGIFIQKGLCQSKNMFETM